jgi:hypothetical protein
VHHAGGRATGFESVFPDEIVAHGMPTPSEQARFGHPIDTGVTFVLRHGRLPTNW